MFGKQVSFKLSPRAERFARIWLLNFAKILAVILASITVGGVVGYLLVLATQVYGTKIVLFSLFVLWLMMLAGVAAGAMSDSQLAKIELEEEKIIRRLRDP